LSTPIAAAFPFVTGDCKNAISLLRSSADASPPYGFILLPGTTSSGFAMKLSSFSLSHTKSAPFMAARPTVWLFPHDLIPVAQQVQQPRGEHRKAILAALALPESATRSHAGLMIAIRGMRPPPLEKCAARVLAVIASHPDPTLMKTVAELRLARARRWRCKCGSRYSP
jgi:hypothetical protein